MKRKYKFQFWKLSNGQWHWHLKAPNGLIMADSGGYNTRSGCRRAIKRFKVVVALAKTEKI